MSDLLTSAAETALGGRENNIPAPDAAAGASPRAEAPAVKKRIDHHIWGIYLVLVMVAILELFSASIQEVPSDNVFYPILRHSRFLGAGLLIMLGLQYVPYKKIFAAIPFYVVGSIALMVYVRFAGAEETSINGAARALKVMGVTILPAEFMKLGIALGMAYILDQTRIRGKHDITWTGWWMAMALLLVSDGLLFTQGLSNTIIVTCVGFSMMLVGGMGWKKFLLAVAVVGALGGGGYYYKTHAPEDVKITERQELINRLNHAEADSTAGAGRGKVWNARLENHWRADKHLEPFSLDHQQEQLSYIAQARGHFIGVGVGKSRENARLPLAYSDYVYAIIVEEWGLFGGLLLLSVYMWLLGRSATLSLKFRDKLPGILTMGCAFVIVFQALYHMAIVTGVFPVSGQPLPLISKGGISVITTSMAFGIMLSCARHALHTKDVQRQSAPESAPAE